MMQIFNARVRLAGDLNTEVARRGLTVPEIYILQRIHGKDAVVGIEHVGYADLEPIDERERLDYEYAQGLAALHEDAKTSVEKLFGGDFAPLPEELRDYSGPFVEKTGTLAEFQESLPFKSPDHETRGELIRKKALEKKQKKATVVDIPPVTAKKPVTSAQDALEAVV